VQLDNGNGLASVDVVSANRVSAEIGNGFDWAVSECQAERWGILNIP
jgi:hypothetical protein